MHFYCNTFYDAENKYIKNPTLSNYKNDKNTKNICNIGAFIYLVLCIR